MTKVRAVIAHEVRGALPAFLFFFVAFHMIAVTKAVTLNDYAIGAGSSTVATIGAVIVAKAILLVEKLPLARHFSDPAAHNILWKALLFGVVAMLFRIVEELLPVIANGGRLIGVAEHLAGGLPWPHFLVMQMWLFALLLLYCLASELVSAIGPRKVTAMLLDRR